MINLQSVWGFAQQLLRRLSDAVYVPTETGSHDMGDHYLGQVASAYVEIKFFPEAGRHPFHRIQVPAGSHGGARSL
jgi:hypothetical protein